MNIVIEHQAFMVAAFISRLPSLNFPVVVTCDSLVSLAFVILKKIDRRFGPGNLRKLVVGTFDHPREIEIIVMFLDLKNVSTHAERIGHVEFGHLRCFTRDDGACWPVLRRPFSWAGGSGSTFAEPIQLIIRPGGSPVAVGSAHPGDIVLGNG